MSFLLPLLLASCDFNFSFLSNSSAANSSASNSSKTSASIPSSPTSTPSDEVASPVSADFLDLFEHRSQASFRITASDSVFAAISNLQGDNNYRKYRDFYFPVNVEISFKGQTYTYEEAGLRVKGNMSREHFFNNGEFVEKSHFKISFKATFDDAEYQSDSNLRPFYHDWSADANGKKERKKRNFLGLEKVDLKYIPRNFHEAAAGTEGSTLREIYAYDAFRRAGIMAPYATRGTITLQASNRSQAGDVEIVETVDKEFLKRRYSKAEAEGDLYKCVYNHMGPANFSRSDNMDTSNGSHIKYGGIGVEDTYDDSHGNYLPRYQLKTNDKAKQDSDFSKMTGLMTSLWQCLYGSGTQQTINSAIDMDEFCRWSAVSFMLGNFDDQRYNSNNFYVYFRPSDNKAVFLPYDWDWCLGLQMGTQFENLKPLNSYTFNGAQQSNLYAATLLSSSAKYDLTANRNLYLGYCSSLKDTVLNIDRYDALVSATRASVGTERNTVASYMATKRNNCQQ